MDNKIDFKELYEKLYKMPNDEIEDIMLEERYYGDVLEFVSDIKQFIMQKKIKKVIENEKF